MSIIAFLRKKRDKELKNVCVCVGRVKVKDQIWLFPKKIILEMTNLPNLLIMDNDDDDDGDDNDDDDYDDKWKK